MIHRSKGFTMTELAVVILITIVLSSVIIPQFLSSIGDSKLRSAAETTSTAMKFARQLSITSRDEVQLNAINGGSELFIVNVDTGDTVRTYDLPVGATVQFISASPHFFPRGVCVPTGTIRVATDAGAKNIIVNITGRVRVEDV